MQHERVVTATVGVPRRTAHDLGPVNGKSFDVVGVLTRVGERMVQLRVCETSGMMRGSQRHERGLTSVKVVQAGTHTTVFHDAAGRGESTLNAQHALPYRVPCVLFAASCSEHYSPPVPVHGRGHRTLSECEVRPEVFVALFDVDHPVVVDRSPWYLPPWRVSTHRRADRAVANRTRDDVRGCREGGIRPTSGTPVSQLGDPWCRSR